MIDVPLTADTLSIIKWVVLVAGLVGIGYALLGIRKLPRKTDDTEK